MKLTNYGKSVLYKLYAFLTYLLPMAILFIWNYSQYTTSDSRLSFFGIVVISFVVIAFKDTVKKIVNYNLFLSVNVVLFVVSLLAYFLAEKLILITVVSFVGSVFSSIFGAVADTYYNLAYVKDSEDRKVKDRRPAISDKEAWQETYLYSFTNIKGE